MPNPSAISPSQMLEMVAEVPFSGIDHAALSFERLRSGSVTIRYNAARQASSVVRPGGTISGPTIFALCDMCAWAVVCSIKGKQALSMTTQCSIDFLRKPLPSKDLVVEGECIKAGARLVVSTVKVLTGLESSAVAHATITYSVPPAIAKL